MSPKWKGKLIWVGHENWILCEQPEHESALPLWWRTHTHTISAMSTTWSDDVGQLHGVLCVYCVCTPLHPTCWCWRTDSVVLMKHCSLSCIVRLSFIFIFHRRMWQWTHQIILCAQPQQKADEIKSHEEERKMCALHTQVAGMRCENATFSTMWTSWSCEARCISTHNRPQRELPDNILCGVCVGGNWRTEYKFCAVWQWQLRQNTERKRKGKERKWQTTECKVRRRAPEHSRLEHNTLLSSPPQLVMILDDDTVTENLLWIWAHWATHSLIVL